MNQPKRVILHCAATPNFKSFDAHDIDKWHRERGWTMIGYHYVITLDGKTQRGREDYDQGAHTAGANRNSLGVCLIGTDLFTTEQVDALIRLYVKIFRQYGIEYGYWHGHYEINKDKRCPGVDMNFVRRLFSLVDMDQWASI